MWCNLMVHVTWIIFYCCIWSACSWFQLLFFIESSSFFQFDMDIRRLHKLHLGIKLPTDYSINSHVMEWPGNLQFCNVRSVTWWHYRVRYLLMNWKTLKLLVTVRNRRHMLTGLSHSVPRSNALDLTSIIQVEWCPIELKQFLNFEHHIIWKIRITITRKIEIPSRKILFFQRKL